MHHSPLNLYNGLTIILGEPSRFDENKLISGYAGQFFEKILLPISRINCDIRDNTVNTDLLPETKVVILLGEAAYKKYQPSKSFTPNRGAPFYINDICYIPTFAPQDAMDRQKYGKKESEDAAASEKDYQRTARDNFRFWLYHDIKKALRILNSSGRIEQYPAANYHIYSPSGEIINILQAHKNEKFVLDIETDRYRNITCFGFCFFKNDYYFSSSPPFEIYVVPIKRYNNTFAYDEIAILNILRALTIAINNNVVVGHNISFDLLVLANDYRILFGKHIFDTMLAHCRCYPEIEKSLGHCISLYLDLSFHKDEATTYEPNDDTQDNSLWHYNGKDIYTSALLYSKILIYAKQLNAINSVKQANASVYSCMMMTLKGAKVNTEALCKLYDNFEARKEQLQRMLNIVTNRQLNPRSSDQVCDYLYEYLGLPKPFNDPTREINLLQLHAEYNVPSIRLIIAIREASKLGSTLKFKLFKNDRITCSWLVGGTESFRLASRSLFKFRSTFKGFGTNMQNWSKKLRHIVEPDTGKIFVQIDQAGAEALIVAYLCRDGNFRSLFKYGIKPHVYVAMHIIPMHWAKLLDIHDIDHFLHSPIKNLLAIPRWKELEKYVRDSDNADDPRYRHYYIAKFTCHSSNYDIDAAMLQMQIMIKSEGMLRLTLAECGKILGIYHSIFPELREWHCMIRDQLERGRILHNLFGFPRNFNMPWGDKLFKEAYAWIPQSTVGTITNMAMTELQNRINEGDQVLQGFDILQNGFDSLLTQCPIGNELTVAKEIKSHIEKQLISPTGIKFQMKSEAAVGYNWGSYHEKKNPQGLQEIKL